MIFYLGHKDLLIFCVKWGIFSLSELLRIWAPTFLRYDLIFCHYKLLVCSHHITNIDDQYWYWAAINKTWHVPEKNIIDQLLKQNKTMLPKMSECFDIFQRFCHSFLSLHLPSVDFQVMPVLSCSQFWQPHHQQVLTNWEKISSLKLLIWYVEWVDG